MKFYEQGYSKYRLWRLTEHKLICGINGLRKAEAVKKMILDNRRITIREVADDVGILFGAC